MDTREDYIRDVTHVFASPNFEDAALLDFKQDSDLYGLTLRPLVRDEAVWTNKIYYRKSDKISSEGEAFPDLVPAGSPASSFPVREDIITIGEGEGKAAFAAILPQEINGVTLVPGFKSPKLNWTTIFSWLDDWNRFIYDIDDYRADPEQYFIVLTPENMNSAIKQKATNIAGYVDQVV